MIRQIIKDYEDIMTFGKYKGKTIEWIVDEQPSYIVWLVENEIIECDDEIYEDVQAADANTSYPDPYDMYNMDD